MILTTLVSVFASGIRGSRDLSSSWVIGGRGVAGSMSYRTALVERGEMAHLHGASEIVVARPGSISRKATFARGSRGHGRYSRVGSRVWPIIEVVADARAEVQFVNDLFWRSSSAQTAERSREVSFDTPYSRAPSIKAAIEHAGHRSGGRIGPAALGAREAQRFRKARGPT